MSKNYTTKTAALNAIVADIHKVSADVLTVGGKEVATKDQLVVEVKHPDDNREVITENDLWGSWAEIKDGQIIFHNDYINNPDEYGCSAWNQNLTKVANNKAYEVDTLYANLETGKLVKGDSMFYNSNLVVFNSDLSSLTSGCFMFSESNNLKGELQYDGCGLLARSGFTTDMSNLQNGAHMFQSCNELESFTGDLSSLIDGYHMFQACTALKEFKSNLSNLKYGNYMFYGCSNLKGEHIEGACGSGYYQLTLDLSSIQNGEGMFADCTSIQNFTITNMPQLQFASNMFRNCSNMESFKCGTFGMVLQGTNYMFGGCAKLKEFNADISKLTIGGYMFADCTSLEKFDNNLESLEYGQSMFQGCTSLKHFGSNLSSLTVGTSMFDGCKLDTDSLTIIADTIKDWSSCANSSGRHTITIGLGYIATDKDKELCQEIVDKGWVVELRYWDAARNCTWGECFANTLELTDEHPITVMQPYYAKPVEATQTTANFVSQDGKYYNIAGGNEIFGDDLSTYGMFLNKENAEEMIAASLGLSPYIYEPEGQSKDEQIETA